MGGECIDLMNECIFVGGLVANVQSGARSYFLRLQLANKGFGSEGPAARIAAWVCCFFFFFLSATSPLSQGDTSFCAWVSCPLLQAFKGYLQRNAFVKSEYRLRTDKSAYIGLIMLNHEAQKAQSTSIIKAVFVLGNTLYPAHMLPMCQFFLLN